MHTLKNLDVGWETHVDKYWRVRKRVLLVELCESSSGIQACQRNFQTLQFADREANDNTAWSFTASVGLSTSTSTINCSVCPNQVKGEKKTE